MASCLPHRSVASWICAGRSKMKPRHPRWPALQQRENRGPRLLANSKSKKNREAVTLHVCRSPENVVVDLLQALLITPFDDDALVLYPTAVNQANVPALPQTTDVDALCRVPD